MRLPLATTSLALSVLLLAACGDGASSDDDSPSGGETGSGSTSSEGGDDSGGASSDGGDGSGGHLGNSGGDGSGGDGSGGADSGSGGEASSETHYLGGIGPDDLTCTCNDGSTVKSCAVIDCEEEAAATTQCTAHCEDRGGFDHASCTDNAPACVGTAKLLCICEDDSIVEICQTIDCFEGNDQEEICDPACASRGGSKAISCLAGDKGCAGGPDLVTCSCKGDLTAVACGSSTCTDDSNLGLICNSACLQAGEASLNECTNDHPACQ